MGIQNTQQRRQTMCHPEAISGKNPRRSSVFVAAVAAMSLLSGCGRDPLTASNIADFIESGARPPESGSPAPDDAPANQGNNDTSVNIETPPSLPAAGTPNLPAILFEYANITLPAHFLGRGPGGSVIGTDNTPADNAITNAGATLGRVLFYDKRLSANNTVACASCHQQALGFADANSLSPGFEGGLTGRRSMGLTNARFYDRGRFFWDERARTLEDQVLMPIQDSVEMGMNLDDLREKLTTTPFYPQLFEDAFGSSTVTNDRISRSLSQFVRSLVSYQSKFDSAFANGAPNFRGVLTAQEDRGRRIYDRNCANCHETNAQVADRPRNTGLDATITDVGAGRGQFKSPSLRNVAVRAPYMHDGRFATLREVVQFYNNGIQRNPELDNRLENNGNPRRMNLSGGEVDALIAFLNTLTDQAFLTDPRFSDPFQ
jgi:cytochrome c peroxidase